MNSLRPAFLSFLFLLSIATIYLPHTYGYNPNCVLQTSQGPIDLNPLTKEDYYQYKSDYSYYLNVCQDAKRTCGSKSWSGVFENQPHFCAGIGKLSTLELSQIDNSNPSKGVILNYYEGSAEGLIGSATFGTELQLNCDPTAPGGNKGELKFLKKSEESRKGKKYDMVYFSINTPHACPTSGQSFWRYGAVGPIVLTILCVGIAAYFVIGILIMKFKFKKTGIEIIPNVHLWIGLAMLVKDGVLFIVDGVKALVNKIKNRGNYQEISGPSA